MQHPALDAIPGQLRDLLRVLESLPAAAFVCNLEGRILFANKRNLQALGYTQDELVGQKLSVILKSSLSSEEQDAVVSSTLAGGWAGEVENHRKDGTLFPVFVETNVYRDKGGEPLAFVAIVRDISEQRAFQKRLLAEARFGTLGLIAHNAAHEVRNHLAAIKMSLYMLEKSRAPASEEMIHFNIASEELNRIELFLRTLENYANPPQPTFEHLDLVEVVNQGLDDARPFLTPKSISLHRQFPRISPRLSIDRNQLAQAITQLIQNAAEAMQAGQEVHIIIKRQPKPEGVCWLIEIRDSGIGVPSHLSERVFEPFFSTAGSNLGLGLSNVRRIMELHHGTVDLVSSGSRGTVVTMSLPPNFRGGAFVMEQLLIIDDEANLGRELSLFFRSKEFETHTALTARDGMRVFEDVRPSFVICDVRLPDGNGIDVLQHIRDIDPESYVIMITAFQDMETTIKAMRQGAFDYIHKPFDPEELEIVVKKATENQRLNRAVTRLQAERTPTQDHMVVGRSQAILEIYKTIGVVSSSNATVLITGESGTGKELIARSIHKNASPEEPFISINCSAIVETLLESELFGHEKGAFTGAEKRTQGKFELAGKGTIFLDEIGDMAQNLQTKLLRVLQEREFMRVGGSETLTTRARVVAATNRSLEDLVNEGKFREDLLYRLKVITIEVPPLRERKDDIPHLVEHFLNKINKEIHKEVNKVPDEVLEQLLSYDWRGNVRELENVLTRAVLLSKGSVLDLPPHSLGSTVINNGPGDEPSPLRSLEEVEAEHIGRVLDAVSWHQGKACDVLGVSRPTLRKKIREYGLKEISPVES